MERTPRLLISLYCAALLAAVIAVGLALLAWAQVAGGDTPPVVAGLVQEVALAVGVPLVAVLLVAWALGARRASSERRRRAEPPEA